MDKQIPGAYASIPEHNGDGSSGHASLISNILKQNKTKKKKPKETKTLIHMVCMCLSINIFINNKILRTKSKRIILGLEVGIEHFIFSPISFIYFVLRF